MSYRGIPVLHLPLVMIGASQRAASVELDVELVGVGPSPIDVHTVVIMGVTCTTETILTVSRNI